MTLRVSRNVSFPSPSCLCLLSSPCFMMKRMLFPLKIILLEGNCWEISVMQHMQNHLHCVWSHKRNNAEYVWLRVTRLLSKEAEGWQQWNRLSLYCPVTWTNRGILNSLIHIGHVWYVFLPWYWVLQWKNHKAPRVSAECYGGKQTKLLIVGLVPIQSSWPCSTQDISRPGLRCKHWRDGLVGRILTTTTGKIWILWL